MRIRSFILPLVLALPILGVSQAGRSPSSTTLYCEESAGENAGQKINACIAALPFDRGGIADATGFSGDQITTTTITLDRPVRLKIGKVTLSKATDGALISVTSSGASIEGIGQGDENVDVSTFKLTGMGYVFDTSAIISSVEIRNVKFQASGAASGAFRVGNLSTNFSNANFRTHWNISNVFMLGPGAAAAGSVGISVTQYIDWYVENVRVHAFERAGYIDRGGNSQWNRVRFQAFKFGPQWTFRGGSGTAADGACQDVCIACEFLGPTTTGAVAGTDFGYTVEIDHQAITFINALYEAQAPTGKSQGLIHFTPHGARFRDLGGAFSWNTTIAGTLDNTLVFDNNYFEPAFFGTILTVPGFPPISFGTPSSPGAKAQFIGTSAELNTLVRAAPSYLSKAVLIGQSANDAAAFDLGSGMLRLEERRAAAPTASPGSTVCFGFNTFGNGTTMTCRAADYSFTNLNGTVSYISISNAGVARLWSYGAGTLTTDANGVVSSTPGINPVLSGTTAAIGGNALSMGAMTSGTVAVTGATSAMTVAVMPQRYPGDGVIWDGYVSSAGTVTVRVFATTAGVTPAATSYNVRVIQ